MEEVSSSFHFLSLRPSPAPAVEEASPDPATHVHKSNQSDPRSFLRRHESIKPSFHSSDGPLEGMFPAAVVMARACLRQQQSLIETGSPLNKKLCLTKRLVSLNKLCISTLNWAREREVMTEVWSSASRPSTISLESSIVGNLLVRGIVELVETVLRDPVDFKAVMLAIAWYGPATIRLRVGWWSRLCVVTVRWALDWASFMMDASNVVESDDQRNVGCLQRSEDSDAGSLIAYA